MIVTKVSPLTGASNSMDIPISEQQYANWKAGRLGPIQKAFPHLTPGQREFLISGVTEEEWEVMWKRAD